MLWDFIFLLSLVASLGFCTPSGVVAYLNEEIQESVSSITKISSENLNREFHALAKSTQLLYCKIREAQIYWTKSDFRNDENRNQAIFRFFSELAKKYQLPDTDFILCTEDGFHKNSPYPLFAFAADRRNRQNVILFLILKRSIAKVSSFRSVWNTRNAILGKIN